jgi:hypothetical protein
MRNMRPSKPTRPSTAMAPQSALQLTRAAIARWTGKIPAATLPRDTFWISVQARHLAQAQRGLADWIAHGGFSQDEEIVMPTLTPQPPRTPMPAPHTCSRIVCLD